MRALQESALGPPYPLQEEGLLPRYKFHLAFENTLCQDYVTEKAYQALGRGVVPVLISAPNAALFLPPHSYVDVARFPTVAALAAHLRYLDGNATAYAEYSAWRRKPFGEWGESGQELKAAIAQVVPLMLAQQRERLAARLEPGSEGLGKSGGGMGGEEEGEEEDEALWYVCSLCKALGGAGVPGASAGAPDSLWAAFSRAQGLKERNRSGASPQHCFGPVEVADDDVGTLTFPNVLSDTQPPAKPTALTWMRRALESRDAEKRALVRAGKFKHFQSLSDMRRSEAAIAK